MGLQAKQRKWSLSTTSLQVPHWLEAGSTTGMTEHLQEVEECLRMGGYAGPAHGQEWGCVTTFKQ